MPQTIKRRVIFAKIVRTAGQSNFYESNFTHDIEAALDPRLHIERYGRTWRVSRTSIIAQSFLAGKLGFQHSGSTEEVYYDDEKEDFVTQERDTQQGNFSHFAIVLNEGLIIFEERVPDIKAQSFIGALKRLFRESEYNLDVAALPQEQGFNEWKNSVERIINFSGTFERPNPQWRPRTERIREILESTNADKFDVDAKVEDAAEGNKSLNLDDPILGGIIEHAQTDYGKFKAVGEARGEKRTYSSEEDYTSTEIEELPDDSTETIFERLIAVLKDRIS